MSKDIRSFFTVQSSKKSNEPEKSKTNKNKETSNSTSKKKRAVIESDSDDDVEIFVEKKKPKPSPEKKKPKIEPKKVNAADVFGTETVKRTSRKSNSNTSEFHNDPDFDKVLQALDESEWTEGDNNSAAKQSASLSKSPPKKDSDSKSVISSSASSSKSPPTKNSNTKPESSSGTSSSKSPLKSNSDSLSPSPPKLRRVEHDATPVTRPNKISDVKASSSSGDHCRGNSSQKVEIKKIDEPSVKYQESTPAEVKQSAPPSYMWVDKYKPTAIKQIIGQQGDKSNVKKLLNWLSSWHSNHGPGVNKKHVRPSPWAKDDSGAYFKAALLSGPPGVGKTTSAHLVCKELGMDVVEFNASDTRSQKLMSKEVSELLSSKSLLPFFQSGGESKTSDRHVLVMDEVDGMAGNEDRGGVAELINLIKNSKCPVICMCNDRNHPKIRSLAGHCFDLRFHKPSVNQIRGAMMSVCFKEKVNINPQALDEVIATTNCDIRQILHNLSMWSSTEKRLNTEQVKTDANAAKKILKLGPWDAVRKMFSAEDHKTMSLIDKSDLFFHDYNIMPLFVQENYLIVSPHAAKKRTDLLHHIARAATSISYGDLIEKTIRSRNDAWSLLPVQSIFSTVVPGDWMEGHFTGQIQFPSWLGKNSRGNKISRLIQELQLHMRLSISGGKQAVNLDYIEPILNSIIQPLINDGAVGVPRTLQAMQDYFVTRDDLDSLLELCQWPGKSDVMARVDSKVKAALTRAYNKSGGFMTPYALDAPVKKSRGASAAYDESEMGLEGEEERVSENDSDNEEVADAMIVAKKKTEKKDSQGNAGSSRGSRGGSRGAKQASERGARGKGRGRGKK